MILPETIATTICKESRREKASVVVRRSDAQIFIWTEIHGKLISTEEAKTIRRGLSRAIREAEEIKKDMDA